MIDVGTCEHDPLPLKNIVLGPYQCPKCKQLVMPGKLHPDYTLIHEPPHIEHPPIADEQHFATQFFSEEDEDEHD